MNLNESFENYRVKPCEKSLAELLQASQPFIYGIALKVSRHSQDAEDLTQEVLIKVIHHINELPQNINFGGWLNRVSLNAAIDHYRQSQHVKALLPKLQEAKKEYSLENEDETIAIIYQHLSKLESADESLILNKFIHALTYDQMSILYKQPRSTIELKINNILKKLKNSIEKAGFAGVALALASTLDHLKATELATDLIPKIKEHFPSTYPQAKNLTISTKVFLKVIVPIVAVLVAYLIFDNLILSNSEKEKPLTELAENKKPIKEFDKEKENVETKIASGTNPTADNLNRENPIASENTSKETMSKPFGKVVPKDSVDKDFAGKLVDGETEAPVIGAKLEIWDIYTYHKIETTTNAEGKYFIPKDLDTTFFFYLKFIKEGYATKQTFQHFETHKKISIKISKGKKINFTIDFKTPFKGELILGSDFNLEGDKHLSDNQFKVLRRVFQCLVSEAPMELYTLKKIKIESKTSFLIDEYFDYDFFPVNGFAIWYEGHRNKKIFNFDDNGVDTSMPEIGIDEQTVENNLINIRMATTGKALVNKELSAYNYATKENFIFDIDQAGNVPIPYSKYIEECVYTIGGAEYFANQGNLYSINENSSSGSTIQSIFSAPPEEVTEEDADVRSGAPVYLIPYVSVLFEPLMLSSELNNTQVIYGNNIFSKKSLFKKTKNISGQLKIYDNHFEKVLLTREIKADIGGVVNVNGKLNETNEKTFKIKITVNNELIKDRGISLFLEHDQGFNLNSPEEILINNSGIGMVNIPEHTKFIFIRFMLNPISISQFITYSKIINMKEVTQDVIALNFNKTIKLEVDKKVIEANIKAIVFDNYGASTNGKPLSPQEKYEKLFNKKLVINENTSIKFPNEVTTIFVEDNVEYMLIEEDCCGIKTKYNQLKAINSQIKGNLNTIEVKPVSEIDYISMHFDVFDDEGKPLDDLNWHVEEVRNRTEWGAGNKGEFLNEPEEPLVNITPEYIEEKTIGATALKSRTVSLLVNRKYALIVSANNYMDFKETFSTENSHTINKKVVLRKSNSVKFVIDDEFEIYEAVKMLKSGDVIYEYNGIRINNKEDFLKTQQACKQEIVNVKLIRDKKQLTVTIAPFYISGIKDCFYDAKDFSSK